jgi:hypothetical protein
MQFGDRVLPGAGWNWQFHPGVVITIKLELSASVGFIHKVLFTCSFTALLACTYYEVLIFSFLEPKFLKLDLIRDRCCSLNSPESDPCGRAV